MSETDQIHALFGSESEVEEEPAEDVAAKPANTEEDILKQAGLEDSDGEAADRTQAPVHRLAGDVDEYEDEIEDEEEPEHQRPIGEPETWQIPLVSRPPNEVQIINFKRLLDIETQPFNQEEFDVPSADATDEAGTRKQASALNMIRWRFTENVDNETGVLKKESNARFVRWSDGSLQLILGKEVLDVNEQLLDQHNMSLCVFHPSNKLLQAQAQVKSRFAVQPHGINSRLRQNQTEATATAPSSKKTAQTRQDMVIRDYEREHQLNVEQEEKRLQLEKRQEKVTRRSRGTYNSLSNMYRKRNTGLTAEALEGADEYDDYDDEDDAYPSRGDQDDDEEVQHSRLLAAKRSTPKPGKRKSYYLDDDDDDFEDTKLSDDDPEDVPPPVQHKRRLVIDDDDD